MLAWPSSFWACAAEPLLSPRLAVIAASSPCDLPKRACPLISTLHSQHSSSPAISDMWLQPYLAWMLVVDQAREAAAVAVGSIEDVAVAAASADGEDRPSAAASAVTAVDQPR